ncbi:alpha-amylase family glycosyl hydrolase [Marinibactrum halimedae]|uniref:Alpha-glucosidase n=1 Tax=Marinibactrum halimedae TaxID=1444977 RepID=A0AA37T990_9GAMM|nr:alpha-amylase family glycosyl hydrolase [Marinibactrum halimedae]MCD9459216.1 alpha-glucosidase family protein [Marinibactrum halimedae]GLS27287.1 alpha-glucosidase [Marinibactrum halimedae]
MNSIDVVNAPITSLNEDKLPTSPLESESRSHACGLSNTTQHPLSDTEEWWRGAAIYQIYPRSFLDTNGDGIGDLPGITQKLDYIKQLGVDAIWISPFFASPMKDFGYDVSDYRAVDPMFGTLEDFDALVQKAHECGLKIIIDQVLSHTSSEHAWFKESRSSRDNSKFDWYVWADPLPDGSPPNNWLSIFGGSAWQWDSRRCQYYLHNFLSCQPDLNFHCEAVQTQILKEVEFWLKRGVDGFRLDAINFCFHDKQLRSNPPKPLNERKGRGFSNDNPYASQYHYFDNTQPEALLFLEKLRTLLDSYDAITTLGEINSEDSLASMAEYTEGNKRLHMGYSFELLADEFSPSYLKNTVSQLEEKLTDGWPCWAMNNHDVERAVTRWGNNENSSNFAKMLFGILATLRGSFCIYQGEELGLNEAMIPFELLQDPFGIEFWPEFKGRDGCRTPMPWNKEKYSGFSTTSPWLPISEQHTTQSVIDQFDDSESVLSFYQKLLHWRKTRKELIKGQIQFLDITTQSLSNQSLSENEAMLAYTRHISSQETLIVANFSASNRQLSVQAILKALQSASPAAPHKILIKKEAISYNSNFNEDLITLKGHGIFIATLARE